MVIDVWAAKNMGETSKIPTQVFWIILRNWFCINFISPNIAVPKDYIYKGKTQLNLFSYELNPESSHDYSHTCYSYDQPES